MGLTVFNLMSDGAVTLEDWSPQIPPVKNSGVWTDSPINDGRQLLAAPVGNVLEKMTILISDRTHLSVMQKLSDLNEMANDCRDYWQTQEQIEPVWLVWSAGCNTPPLPQYALISNIEFAPTYQQSDQPSIEVSLTIEREPYWSVIPPGANPKLWTYFMDSAHPQFNLNTASLVTGSDHLITQTIQNKFEWNPTAYGLQATPITQNYIQINAAQVPGDAPALVEMSISADVEVTADIYIGKTSKKLTGMGHDAIARVNSLILNAGDSTGTGTKNSVANTIGVKSNGSSTLFYNVTRTSTGIDAGWSTVCSWGGDSYTNGIRLDRQLFRGTYAVFARCDNNSGTPVIGDMRIRVLIEELEGNAANQYLISQSLPETNPPLAAASPPLTYMGIITMPLAARSVNSPLGYGIQLEESNANLKISFQNRVDVATANRIVRIIDLVFMPIDEGLAQIALAANTISVETVNLLDNTGYLNHGERKQSAVAYVTNANSGGVSQEVRGQAITLQPNVDQRLYFIMDSFVSASSVSSRLTQQMTVRLNIVPRWLGIRGV